MSSRNAVRSESATARSVSSASSGTVGCCATSPSSPIAAAACRAGTLIDQFDDITRDGLVLSPETVEAIGRAEQRRNRWTAVALWAIAALLAVVAWKIM